MHASWSRKDQGRRSPALWVGALLALGASGSCVLTPHSRTVVAAGTRAVTFTGYFPPSGAPTTKIQISVQDGDTWVPVGSPADINSSSGIWSVTVPVPTSYWKPPCEAAVFKAATANGVLGLLAFDQYCLDSLPPNSDFEVQQTCLQPKIVLQRATAAGTVSYTPPSGELNLAGPDEAELYRCVSTVIGDLTIDGGGRPSEAAWYRGVIVAMPNLVEVTGKLTITGNHAERLSFPTLQHVGTAAGVTTGMKVTLNRFYAAPLMSGGNPTPIYNTLEAPVLTSVGGLLELHNVADPNISSAGQLHYPFGMNALTQVGSVLALDDVCPPSGIDGLAGLITIPGNVTLEWRRWELYGGLLPNLDHIGGNLVIASRNLIYGPVLPGLHSVAGDVTFTAPGPSDVCMNSGTGIICNFQNEKVLEHLEQIGGDLNLQNCSTYNGAARFPALTSVGGTLRITGSLGHFDPVLGATGASPLVMGNIDFHDSTLPQLPLHADAQLAAGATVAIHDNPLLCQCTVEAYLTSHTLPIGATTCANGASAVCAACGTPSQCP